jgi:acyl-CoA hydrolase
MDFMRGAALAPDGRAIIALPSTADGGRVSRIVPTVRSGAGIVTTRAHVRTVVTEYGTAELYGRSLGERARALIAIAHPDFRDELTHAAREHPTLDPGGLRRDDDAADDQPDLASDQRT